MTRLQKPLRHIPALIVAVIVLIFTAFGGWMGLALARTTPPAAAQPPVQPPAQPSTQTDTGKLVCEACHPDVVSGWKVSPHHNAFSDQKFQDNWTSLNQAPRCLECHTTGYSPATGNYSSEGVSCTACHGAIPDDHPKTPIDLSIANNACRNCHVITFAEFRASMHEAKGLTCTTCHYAHENGLRLGDQIKQCLNCHGNQLTDFAHVSHVNAGLKCRHCHGYVEPGQEPAIDGLVPTGHDFRESVRACVDCHKGMKFVPAEDIQTTETPSTGVLESGPQQAVDIAELHAQIDTLNLQSQNRTTTGVVYGGLGGLTIGGVVAWFVARRSGKSA